MEQINYVFLADGFEEIEALTVVDLLRRAGLSCVTVAVNESGEKAVTGSHNITVLADTAINKITLDNVSCLILPGGMPGTKNLKENEELKRLLLKAYSDKIRIAAICAAPTILAELNMLDKIDSTCYPTSEDILQQHGAIINHADVITSGNITTSRGMGTAIAFGLELVKLLLGPDEAEDLQSKIVYRR
ncbi:MAG: DJ-1/PfpI family protein [Lachnospiraceae bacterium]|nr:DJ-1/PfpI family protein [Lachnospiraceae bacterium]